MMKSRLSIGLGLVVALSVSMVVAQEGAQRDPNMQRGPNGRSRGRGPGAGLTRSVAALVTNEVIANAIGLTLEQQESMATSLDADKARLALAAAALAENVVTILTDPEVAADLSLTTQQVIAIEDNVTPELIKRALTAQEIERLSRGLSGGALAGSIERMMRDRMKQFDTNGDGRISDEERRAMMDRWRQRMGGGRNRGNRDRNAQRDRDAGPDGVAPPPPRDADVDDPAAVE